MQASGATIPHSREACLQKAQPSASKESWSTEGWEEHWCADCVCWGGGGAGVYRLNHQRRSGSRSVLLVDIVDDDDDHLTHARMETDARNGPAADNRWYPPTAARE